MDITSAFDVAAGLVLMYLVLSLLCTTINELISNAVGLRSKTLASALQQLIDDPEIKKAFDLHGLIDGAGVAASGGRKQTTIDPTSPDRAKPTEESTHNGWITWLSKNGLPTYLSGQTVAEALIGVVGKSSDPGVAIPTIDSLKARVQVLPDSNIRDALIAALTRADGSITALHNALATWYDNEMDRLSGAYKRYLQAISFVVGLVVAASFNADTLHVGNTLWHDRSLSESIANAAPAIAQQACPKGDCTQAAGAQTLPIDNVEKAFNSAETNLREFPIGWAEGPNIPVCWYDWIWKALGLLITAAALMLGAPFWFDALSKIMNVRGTGAKPPKTATAGK